MTDWTQEAQRLAEFVEDNWVHKGKAEIATALAAVDAEIKRLQDRIAELDRQLLNAKNPSVIVEHSDGILQKIQFNTR